MRENDSHDWSTIHFHNVAFLIPFFLRDIMPTIIGKLVIDEEGKLCVKTTIGPGNPELYNVPLEELLEDFVDKTVHVEIWPAEAHWKEGDD
jgi:hypothetical protein